MSRAIMINDETVNVIINGRSYTADIDSQVGETVLDLLREGASDQEIVDAMDIRKQVATFSDGCVTIDAEGVKIYGEKLPEVLAQRLQALIRTGLPFTFLRNFWLRLKANPSWRSVEQLYTFCENEGMAITETGMIRAYKAITGDWKDKHTRTISNTIGSVVTMDRNEVCDDPRSACHVGLHIGSLEYAKGFMGFGDRLVIVEVDPKDVVSVPIDSSCQKMRACKYQVIEEYKGKLPEFISEDAESSYDSVEEAIENDDLETVEPRAEYDSCSQILTIDLSEDFDDEAKETVAALVKELRTR